MSESGMMEMMNGPMSMAMMMGCGALMILVLAALVLGVLALVKYLRLSA
tara:strand:+ start:7818 stop:7964 length:147 start_codon:yes stop_codon:yes gene_type:complete